MPNDLIDELTFRSYAHNRGLAPDVSPERWAKIFPNGPAMEARLQREREQNAGARIADDCWCLICGKRGVASPCPECRS
jgi:hypothetical protein